MVAVQSKTVVLTYNGLDGACAAAAVLLKWPDAQVRITSARRVAGALLELVKERKSISDVHVCGVGIHCPIEEVTGPVRKLHQGGVNVRWYCGRGYLRDHGDALARDAEPVFHDAASNAEAVCIHLGLWERPAASVLLELARHDPNIEMGWRQPTPDEELWVDLINAAIAEYFKYQDENAYVNAIRRLARQNMDERDRNRVEVFRRAGFKHVLWGRSEPMRGLRGLIRKCADADEPVLISGESGVGKEYVAHLIHERSERAMGSLIPVNCGLFAGNAALANSVLFGHVKGAYTGALKDRDGAFVSADSGILFLDELAELPAEVQPKFVRVVEDGWVTPEGSDEPRQVDVRVVAATNRSLPELIRQGTFRADLYHRLCVLEVRVPPLREHIEDVGLIVQKIMPTLGAGAGERKLTAEELGALRGYDWPGNVRQLIKVLKRALLLGSPVGDVLEEEKRLGILTETGNGDGGGGRWPRTAEEIRPIRDMRSEYAARAFELTGGNYAETARRLGVAVNTLRSYLSGD
jgi:DNA-binding NtrC family response regulator